MTDLFAPTTQEWLREFSAETDASTNFGIWSWIGGSINHSRTITLIPLRECNHNDPPTYIQKGKGVSSLSLAHLYVCLFRLSESLPFLSFLSVQANSRHILEDNVPGVGKRKSLELKGSSIN